MNKNILINLNNSLELDKFTLLDIGASGGIEKKWAKFEEFINIVGYEPDKNEFDNLIRNNKTPKNIFINAALGRNKTESKLYITKKQQLSSLLKPDPSIVNKYLNSERFDITNEVDVHLITVDQSLQDAKIKTIDFFKIDTQGSELDILKGSNKTLEHVVGIEIEVEFNPIYVGQPIYSEVDTYIRNLGFELMDFEPAYYLRKENNRNYSSSGQIMFANAIYFPNDQYLKEKINKDFLRKLVFTSLVYKKYDYTMYLLTNYSEMLSEKISKSVVDYLDSVKVNRPSFIKRIYNILNNISRDRAT